MNHRRTGSSPNNEVVPGGTVQEPSSQPDLPPLLTEQVPKHQPLTTILSTPSGLPAAKLRGIHSNEGSSALLRRKRMELVMPYGPDGTLRKEQTDWEVPTWLEALVVLLVFAICLLAVEAAFGWVGVVLKQVVKLVLKGVQFLRGGG